MPVNNGIESKCQNERIQETGNRIQETKDGRQKLALSAAEGTEDRKQRNERWGDLGFLGERRQISTAFSAKQSQSKPILHFDRGEP